MQRRTKLEAIAHSKCPRCRQGDMFQYPIYKITKFDKMHKNCPACNLRYEVEPGFFFGAMYISYAITVAVLFNVALILFFVFNDPELWVYTLTVPLTVIVLLPFIFRISRVLFLHIFGGVSYNEEYAKLAE